MLDIKKIDYLDEVKELKKQFFSSSTAPLDGMWHFGFAPIATHFGFYDNDVLVGFCCVNADGYMLQFYLSPVAEIHTNELFTSIAQQKSAVIGEVKGAFVSTAEPSYLSLCLDNSSAFKMNSLMYKRRNSSNENCDPELNLSLAKPEQLDDFVVFAVNSIGAPEQWLTEYYGNLIERRELFGYWKENKLLATGECRLFDEYQTEFAELGMIVFPAERGQGIATRVLRALVSLATKKNLTPICSTEVSNVAAQKAISNAGLVALNRIIQIEFD